MTYNLSFFEMLVKSQNNIKSDLGSQYTSNLFESAHVELKIRYSYSRKGCPYDNAYIESFHFVLKKEEVTSGNIKIKKPLTTQFLNTLNPGITASELFTSKLQSSGG